MNHLRTAAQQALEALYEADTFHRSLPDQRARRLAAMAALRAALAQQAEPVEEPITRLFGTLPVHDTQQDEPEGSVCARCGALAFDPLVKQQVEPVLVQGELPPRYVARSPIQAEPVEPAPAAAVATQSDVWRGYNGQWVPPGEPIKMVQMLRDLPTGTLLYTAPPQRRPLSEVDLRALYDRHAACQEEGPEISGWWDFARAVERAHGIKE